MSLRRVVSVSVVMTAACSSNPDAKVAEKYCPLIVKDLYQQIDRHYSVPTVQAPFIYDKARGLKILSSAVFENGDAELAISQLGPFYDEGGLESAEEERACRAILSSDYVEIEEIRSERAILKMKDNVRKIEAICAEHPERCK